MVKAKRPFERIKRLEFSFRLNDDSELHCPYFANLRSPEVLSPGENGDYYIFASDLNTWHVKLKSAHLFLWAEKT